MSAAGFVSGLACILALASAASAQTTERISVSSSGAQSQGSCEGARVSDDGRFVAFSSFANDLVPVDTNLADVFVRDRLLGTTQLVDLDSGGAQANGACGGVAISGDGRFVAFDSDATNLVPGDTNGVQDVFVRDRLLGTTERVSVSSGGLQGDGGSSRPSISGDGRYVAFQSSAGNLASGETNVFSDVFVRDRQLGTTGRVSDTPGGASGAGTSFGASISADGRFVAFTSEAADLVPNDLNGAFDVFVADLQLGSIAPASVNSAGFQANDRSLHVAISSNGRFATFYSEATNLDAGDTSLIGDVFVRDLELGTTERASVDAAGGDPNQFSFAGGVSDDGRYVLFSSDASDLVAGDTNAARDVFLRDRLLGITRRLSLDPAGQEADGSSHPGSISPDGRWVGFHSDATDLVAGDTNGASDVFLRDRAAATGFASICDPGLGGVMACPCGNPPSGPGRGCDNSAGTGGAILSATGSTSLSFDTLVFTTSGERATALSIVSQWSAPAAAGITFGQGVRCATGTLKRMYVKSAVGGSITAPNLQSGDPQVSVRSASLGNPIAAGESRWYLVYYRDGVVLGGCPPTSTFNATQTGVVTWSR